MPQADVTRPQLPLAMCVLRDELDDIEARVQALAQIDDGGERDARRSDLLRALDRYLRLEEEVFHPVLDRSGIDYSPARASHIRLRAALAVSRTDARDQDGTDDLGELHAALRAHRRVQDRSTLPDVARQLGCELPGLAIELQEVLSRMKGTYGV